MNQVTIQGVGTFYIDNEKVQELISWLSMNQGVKTPNPNDTLGEINNSFSGKELLKG
ncbi:MAG: hypothetical protein RL728_181 [Bacteroidota bacterium]|jgi:hypothetical protein